jgi:hypothetical protein
MRYQHPEALADNPGKYVPDRRVNRTMAIDML